MRKINKNATEVSLDGGSDENKEEKVEGFHLILIPNTIYHELDTLCKINKLNTDKKIISILETEIDSAEVLNENGVKKVFNF